MEIVTTIIGKFVEPIGDYTVAPIARQVGYLIFYRSNFKNLEDQIAELKRVKDTIVHEVEAERRNGRQIYDVVHNWLNTVDEIVEAAEQLSNDPRHRNVGCCKGPFPDLKSRHHLSRKAKKMAGNVAEVTQQIVNIGPLAFLPDLEGVGSTSATSSAKLESRKKMKEDIVLALRDPHLSRIGVYGLGGVGKTTLVKEIAKQVRDDKLFDEVVMANISQAADLERIQGEIADFLGLRFQETTIVGRASRLSKRIKNEKSILVILDDIWAALELEKLGIPMNHHEGCKLLLTSRNLDILQRMETQKDFFIDVLNEEEAWSLFEDMVGDVAKDIGLRDMAIQVAKKCSGLIVLIVTVARALKNEDNIDSWNDALNQLKTVDKDGMNEKIYSALEFSYNHIEGDDVKALFLLCGLLGLYIDVEDLLRYAMGLGIFKQIYTLKNARFKLHRLIRSLKSSCLLLESKSNKFVKMHDIVREVAISIASRDKHVYKIGRGDELKTWPSEEFLQRCTTIIVEWCHIPELPKRLECPIINAFCFRNSNEALSIPDSFFEGMKNLKVLDLTCMHLPSLPQSFHSLIDLQTLRLHHCVLGDMTNIGALTNLQILSLQRSSMITLPCELGKLTHLSMLDLTYSRIEIVPYNIIPKLIKLEEVYLGNTSMKWDQQDSVEENKNASLTELRHLTNLTTLEIQIRGAWVLPRDVMFDKLERFKIVIGDVWKWSDNYGASKILKLKLGNVIHLEHGIKELIKGVEVLYLDEVNGISNVLDDLNREGFPLLKHLHIQNNGKIQHMINSTEKKERKLSHPFFPKLEILVLQNLNKLENIWHDSFMNNSFANLRSVRVKCCDQLKYLFTVLMVKALSQLVDIEVLECSSMKKIVFVENSFPNSVTLDDSIEFCSLKSLTLQSLPAIEDFYHGWLTSSITTTRSLSSCTDVPSCFFNAKVKFSNLETLTLSSIHRENIWQDDKFSVANSFHELANLSIKQFSGLKYLFSSSMIGSFANLKKLEITECEMMEEIIGTEVINGAAKEEVGLPKLETVIISNMKRLKKVWHSQFDGLKTMEVNDCEKLENIFPSDMHTTFGRIETLKVRNCDSVKEIFRLPGNEIKSEGDTQLKKLHLLRLPMLKQIWSKDPQGNFCFHNLQDVLVKNCENLEYLFPFSVALDLRQLENLTVDSCGMNEIVAKKEGPVEENPIFHLNRLFFLQIGDMRRLDRFYDGSHSLTCPSLRMLWFFNCAKLKLWGIQSTSHHHRKSADHHNPHLSSQQPLFIAEEVLPKLEEWTLNNEEAVMILQDPQWKDHYLSKLKVLCLSKFEDKVAATFLDSIVEKAPNLKTLSVQGCSLKEMFRDERVAYKEGKDKINTQLEVLNLTNLQLQHICREGCRIDPVLEVLERLYVIQCANLKTLVPSSVTFYHLTYLVIIRCNGLVNLIYPSTASNLVNLQGITLKECNSLEEIVTHSMNETRDGIVFRSLRTLHLESLPRLNSFSSTQCFFKFPLLREVLVRQCARMKTFCERATSTPLLRKVITKKWEDEDWYWEGDLNGTIKKIYIDKVAFQSFNHLEFSEYPELKELWYAHDGQKIFCNLKYLVVRKCGFLSNIIFSSNLLQLLYTLEELEIAECDSLEAVFNIKALDDKAMESKEVSRLKKLTLSGLPNLKCIWNREAGEIISFRNLQILKVDKCQHLKNLFSVSQCQDLRQLQELQIESCGVEEIVSIDEGLGELKFDFPRLTILRLFDLRQLTHFYPKRYILECPSLKTLNVRGCEELRIFAFDQLDSKPLSKEVGIELQTEQALFHIEKVSQNLERLSLNENDTMRILNGNYEENLFQSIRTLRLQHFQETPIKFLNHLVQKFPTITTLQTRCSSFKTLFPLEEIGHYSIESSTKIKTLWLFQLKQLELIGRDDDSALHPLIQNLENMYIVECSNIIRLAPPSVSFKKLTSLKVKDCRRLTFFMTCCTAKSLAHLISLEVINCGILEEVVITDEGEAKEEITFENLKYLKLIGLSYFRSFCYGKHTFVFPSLVTLTVMRCPKMQNFSSGAITAPFLKSVQVEYRKECWKEDLNTTIKQLFLDKAIGGVKGDHEEPSSTIMQSSQTYQKSESTSGEHEVEPKAVEIVDSGKQEMHKLPIPHAGVGTQKLCEIVDMPLGQASQNTFNLTKVDKEIDSSPSQTLEAQTPSIQDEDGSQHLQLYPSENLLVQATTSIINDDEENTGNREMHETIQRELVQNDEDMSIPASVQDIATGIHAVHENIEIPFTQATQKTWDNTIAQKKEDVRDSDIHLSKNLFDRTIASMAADYKETIGTQESYESKWRFSVPNAQNVSSPIMIHDTAIDPALFQVSKGASSSTTTPEENVVLSIGTQEIRAIMEKPLIQSDQDAEKLATATNTEESRESYVKTQKTSDTIEEPTIPATQNVPNSTMITEAALDPSASQAQEPMIPSIQESNIYRNFKGMVDIPEQNMPYLEAGLERHPQILDWLNTKRPRVLASSSFSLFSEVTRILRTTRRVNLTEDYQSYIKECCAALQGVGFDESWISYVQSCIEECAGDEEGLERKAEEAEAQIESMKKELASLEEALVLLRHKASGLHDFIKS